MLQILTDVVLTVTGFQLVLLALVLLVQLPGNLRRSLLVAFLLTKALLILRWFSFRFGLLDGRELPALYLCSAAGFFLLAPLLACHVRAVCYRDFRLRWSTSAHLLPFAAMLGLCGLEACNVGGWTSGIAWLDDLLAERFWTLFWTSNLVQIAVYVVVMFSVVARYRRQLGDRFASFKRIDLQWLVALLVVLSLHWLFVTSRSILGLLEVETAELIAALDLFSITIFLVFTTVLVIRGMALARVFPGIEQSPQVNGSPMDEEQVRAVTERLAAFMRSERPHLQPSLTLDELATRLSLPSWQLSRVVNTALQQNFFNFINRHRVEEARHQLENPACNRKTMLQILHESGFNSKSTFNEAFKRHTGMTPSQYRTRAQRDAEPAAERQDRLAHA